MRKHSLEIIVFICGAVVMIIELDGSRILAPYLGTSIIVWTCLIGIILGSLSIGYFYGGLLADKRPSYGLLAAIILAAGIFVGLLAAFKEILLAFFENLNTALELKSVIATLALFAPPGILLGMVSPFALKLKVDDLEKTGKTAGNLYALSALGSIFGTFLAGFFLIPALGNTLILLIIALSLIAVALLAKFSFTRLVVSLAACLVLLAFFFIRPAAAGAKNFIDLDTKYNRIWIYDDVDADTARPVKIMKFENSAWQSAMFLDNPKELVFKYLKYFDLAFHFNPAVRDALLIGGAAYSYPKYFIDSYPQANLDVIEIDPGLTGFAKKYFALQDNPRLKIIHQDGRVFLNKNRKLYDAILIDAFFSVSIPAHLTTLEMAESLKKSLADDGVVILNLISAFAGPKSDFLKAEYSTYKQIFSHVILLQVNDYPEDIPQNIILIASESGLDPEISSNDHQYGGYLSKIWGRISVYPELILTDDHAPTEYYSSKIMR